MEPTPALIDPVDPMPRRDRRAWWATLFVLCGLLGAMLGLSVKTQTVKTHNETLANLQGRTVMEQANLDLQRRIAQLQKDNSQLAQAAPSDTKRVKELSDDLAKAQFLAGLTDVKGPGIIVTLNDSKKPSVVMPAGFAPPNIIHDTDIGAVINELKAAGAEAISDQRPAHRRCQPRSVRRPYGNGQLHAPNAAVCHQSHRQPENAVHGH